jgi:hypothetical protein
MVMGGCFGKSLIESLSFKGPSCVFVSADNCQGGVLDVSNLCDQDLRFGNVVIGAHDKKTRHMELFEDAQGQVQAQLTQSGFASYTPDETEWLEMKGYIGDEPVSLGYKKTRDLCP